MTTADAQFYDRQEVRDPAARHAQIFNALPGLVRHALENAPALAGHLEGIEPGEIGTPEALASLPVLRKSELLERQRAEPPFGGLVATPTARLAKVFSSPGPIFEPEAQRPDYWRFARALFAAGFRRGDLIHNTFAYHLTPAGSMLESGARALGCPVIPAGVGQTEKQLEVIAHLRPTAYVGTPSFLKVLLEKLEEGGQRHGFEKALVSGEAFPPPLQEALRERFGVDGYQCYATADLGLIAFETPAREGLVADEAVLIELVKPGTGKPVAKGEVGEVVVTAFNPDYPLIRFATGDLSAFLEGQSACGRTNLRIKGWMGRADQSAKVRGMFVHPHQIQAITGRHGEKGRARLVVSSSADQDQMLLMLEHEGEDHGLEAALESTIRQVTGLRSEVELVAPGSLANDGKVIDDRRG